MKSGSKVLLGFGIGCVGIIVLIIIISVAVSSGSKSNSSSGNKSGSGQTKTDFAVGETINLNDHQLIVNSVNPNFSSGNEFDKPQDPANSFVVVNVTLVNTGNNDLLVNDWGFKLEDETGTQRDSAMIAGMDNSLQSVTLSHGGKISGNIGFEAKANSSKLILHYSGNIGNAGGVTIKLK
jgi:hypothetical protein